MWRAGFLFLSLSLVYLSVAGGQETMIDAVVPFTPILGTP